MRCSSESTHAHMRLIAALYFFSDFCCHNLSARCACSLLLFSLAGEPRPAEYIITQRYTFSRAPCEYVITQVGEYGGAATRVVACTAARCLQQDGVWFIRLFQHNNYIYRMVSISHVYTTDSQRVQCVPFFVFFHLCVVRILGTQS